MKKTKDEAVTSYEQLLKDKKVIKGNVKTITTIEYNGEYEVKAIGISSKAVNVKDMIYIPITELTLPKSRVFLKTLLGRDLDFRIKTIEESGRIIGERASIIAEKKIKFLKDAAANPDKVYKAMIKKTLDHGAYLSIGDIDVFMYNSAFAEGYIPIKFAKKEGETVEVLFNKVNPKNDQIYVKMKEKYTEEQTLDLTAIKPQDIMKGIVRTKTVNLCFVNIAPMVDVLCSPVAGIEVGQECTIKIVGFKEKEDGGMMVRGKILVAREPDDGFRL